MQSIISNLFSANNDNKSQQIIEKLLSISDKSLRQVEIERVSKEFSEKSFKEQVDFVIAVLDWCKTIIGMPAVDNTNWTISLVLRAVLNEMDNYSIEQKKEFVLTCIDWFGKNSNRKISYYADGEFSVELKIGDFIKKGKLESEEDFLVFITWMANFGNFHRHTVGGIINNLKRFLKNNSLSESLKMKIIELADVISRDYFKDVRKKANTLRELAGIKNERNPIVSGEAWSDSAIADISNYDEETKTNWITLINECQKANGSTPNAKWIKTVTPQLEKIGFENFKSHVLQWFPLVDKPRTQEIATWSEWQPNPNLMINDVNADILKGLVWICGINPDRELAHTLNNLAISAYKKVPQIGPRCVRVGNACVWALGQMGLDGVGQLAVLKLKVKAGNIQKAIEKALNESAKKLGLPPEELEEMSVPTYGLTEVGIIRETFGETTVELIVTGTNTAEIRWLNHEGKQLKTVPKQVKEEFGEELKELNQSLKDIKKMLPAQRDRLENLYLEEKTWDYPTWRERYLEHPLVGTIARRLIWLFDSKTPAIWLDGKLVDVHGEAVNLSENSQVKLWHPLDSTMAEVLQWREFLEKLEIQQPFKQAYREIYVLTDAEIRTQVYSNRFAAHIIKQHQFNSLCGIRGWKNRLHLMVDDAYEPPTRFLPKRNLRAEFWIEAVGEEFGTDTTESGTYLYLATDQVRFYPTDAQRHYVHAGGGGYTVGWNQPRTAEPIFLQEIPPLIFSEIMRDVDMFVGVCSIGNDPNWQDGGREIHNNYWYNYSFGDLSETAKTRKQILERLIPRLKIAERCSFEDKFLIVKGDLRTYKIHLGSGNILMSPNDQYLCIVASSSSETFGQGKVFLPFEGDRTLSIILSKAFMLAEDTKITDKTITRQIQR